MRYRIVKLGARYYVEGRRRFSPFWIRLGGDELTGPYEWNSLEEAKAVVEFWKKPDPVPVVVWSE